MANDPKPSFSVARKWSLSLSMLLALGAVVALLVMVNYLAARHFMRWSISEKAQTQLSPLTLRVLASVTSIVSELGANIEQQQLGTTRDVGYLVMDVDRVLSEAVRERIAALPVSIKTRLLY